MRLLKLGIISIAVLFLLLTAIGSLFPSVVLVSRSVDINSPVDTVGKYIDDFNKWNDWMEGAKTNDLKVFVKDSMHAIFGNTVITLIDKQSNNWRYEWKQGGTTQISMIHIAPHNNGIGCLVQWQYEQHLGWYPWAKLASVMNEKIIASSLDQNLANLKKIAEH